MTSPEGVGQAAGATGAQEAGDARRGRRHAQTFTALLDSIAKGARNDDVTLRDLLFIVGRRSFGPIILLLGFIAISPLTIIPGANWFIGGFTLLISIQLLFGRRHPVLPRQLLDLSFKRTLLMKVLDGARLPADIADRITMPRLMFMTQMPFLALTALCLIAASLIGFPLALVPLGPVLPGLSIVMFGVGLTARDGLFLLLAIGVMGAAGYMLVEVLPNVVSGLARMVGGMF
jgi:hypothetical protein